MNYRQILTTVKLKRKQKIKPEDCLRRLMLVRDLLTWVSSQTQLIVTRRNNTSGDYTMQERKRKDKTHFRLLRIIEEVKLNMRKSVQLAPQKLYIKKDILNCLRKTFQLTETKSSTIQVNQMNLD